MWNSWVFHEMILSPVDRTTLVVYAAGMVTPDIQVLIQEAYLGGLSEGEIALRYDYTPSTIYRVLQELGIKREHRATTDGRAYRSEIAPQVKELLDAGMTPSDVCKQLHLGYNTFRQIADENGWTYQRGPVGRPSTKAQKLPLIKEMATEGKSLTEVSRALGVSFGTLSRWAAEEGIIFTHRPGPGHPENFGRTLGAQQATGRKGGLAAAEKLVTKRCLYCGGEIARYRANSGRWNKDQFCSREHAYAHRRETSGKTKTYVCQLKECGKAFQGWTNNPRSYCCREHWAKAAPNKIVIGTDRNVIQLDSSWEALFYGLYMLLGVPCQKYDRSTVVEWVPGNWYAPDFLLGDLYIQVKGYQTLDDELKWAAWSQQIGRHVVLYKTDLDALRRVEDADEFTKYIQRVADKEAQTP